ncbi:MAG: hypothetical protein CMF51_02940 [Legionellales bacterium]|nr:hypothetical protein [Legionellales bacterium]
MTGVCAIWVETYCGCITPQSYAAFYAAQALGKSLVAWVVGPESAAAHVACWSGIERVYHAPSDPSGVSIEALSQWCYEQASSCEAIVGAVSHQVNGLFPRLAGMLAMPMVTGVEVILSPQVFQRSSYSGQVCTQVTVNAPYTLISIHAAHWMPFSPIENQAPVAVDSIPLKQVVRESRRLPVVNLPEDNKGLHSKYVVGIGGGVLDPLGFKSIQSWAHSIGATVGVTRPLVEAGIADQSMQIGQSGQTIAPDVYLCFGVSGAMQHCSGIQASKVIVSINIDPQAPLHTQADFIWVEDWTVALTALQQAWLSYNQRFASRSIEHAHRSA